MAFFSWSRWFRALNNPRVKPIQKRKTALTLEQLETRLAPAQFTWTGMGNGKFSDANDWAGHAAPLTNNAASNDTLVFAPTSGTHNAVNDISNLTFSAINFFDSGYNLSGNTLILGGATVSATGQVNVSQFQTDTIALSMQLGIAGGTAQDVFNIGSTGSGANAAVLTITGQLSSLSSNEGLSKTGQGELILAGDNSALLGAVNIGQGIVQVTSATGLGTSATAGNVTTVQSGAQLQVSSAAGLTLAEHLKLNGSGIFNDGALLNVAGKNTWTGVIELDSNVTIGANGVSTLTITGTQAGGQITDLGAGHGITKEGTGTLVFATANNYRGQTTINNGVLQIQNGLSLGTGDGAAQDGVIVNSAIGKAGTLQIKGPAAGTGISILNKLLTLNGGGYTGLGALDNLQGNNFWTGNVIIGTQNASGSSPTIRTDGRDPVYSLTIGGVVQDASASPATAFSLLKTGVGTLIFTNSNTYTGTTFIEQGILEIEDSHGLGQTNKFLGTTVFSGATLELAVDNIPDSVTGTTNSLNVNVPLTINGNGDNGLGALYSFSGINTFSGSISLGSNAAIGVNKDPNPTNSASYFANDYSLTVSGIIVGASTLTKVGQGQLILPGANPNFTGNTAIANGWITIGNNDSLGSVRANLDQNLQALVTVFDGGALHLKAATGQNLDIHQNLKIAGQGIHHPFSQINQQGAIENVAGINTIEGNIVLNGQAGIGVEKIFGASQLSLLGQQSQSAPALSVAGNATGSSTESDNIIDTGSTSGSVTINYNMYYVPDTIDVYYGIKGQGGVDIYSSGPLTGAGAVTVPYGPLAGPPALTTTTIEIVIDQGNGTPGTVWTYNATVSPASLTGGINKLGSQLLDIQGDGTFTGAVDVKQGVLLDQNNTGLGAGNTTGSNVTVESGAALGLANGTAYQNGGLQSGIQVWGEHLTINGSPEVQTITVGGTNGTFTVGFNGQTTHPLAYNVPASGGVGILASLQNALDAICPAGGFVTVTGGPSAGGVYTVTFGGTLASFNQAQMTVPATTGTATASVATVTDGMGNTTMGRPLAPLFVMNSVNAPQSSTRIFQSSPLLASLASDQVVPTDDNWRGPITLGASTPIDVTAGSRLIVDGAIDDASNKAATGSDLITVDTGELLLADASSYRGNTYVGTIATTGAAGFDPHNVNEFFNPTTPAALGVGGTLTVGNNQALGAPSAGGVVVQGGSTLQLQGNLNVVGKTLTVQGAGLATVNANTLPQNWFEQGPAPINGAQTPGNNASAGRMTGLATDPNDPLTMYGSSAGGGVWRTINGGLSWTPMFDSSNGASIFAGAIAVDPTKSNILYLGTGEANNSGDSFYGTGVYKSTDYGHTWTLLTGTTTPASNSGAPANATTNPFYGQAISKIVVDPTDPTHKRIYVASSDQPVNGQLYNGVSRNAGVWRFDANGWFNLTNVTSDVRQGTLQPNSTKFPTQASPPSAAPNSPGPDDDWRLNFYNTNVDYSDIALTSSGVLYMATYAPSGFESYSNAVYRLMNPSSATATAGSRPVWYVGDGNPSSGTPPGPVYSTGGSKEFPTNIGATPVTERNGLIRLVAMSTSSFQPLATTTVYAAITNPLNDQLLEIQKTSDGGQTWAAVTANPANYLGNQGSYDSAILMPSSGNVNTVYVAGCVDNTGKNYIQVTTDGGATWKDISVDSAGNGPHTDEHALAAGADGKIYVGGDGGFWQYNPTTGLWKDVNGNLATNTLNSLAVNPGNPDIYIGGSQDNGSEVFNGASQQWTHVVGGDGGLARFTPNNPNVVYTTVNGFLEQSTTGYNGTYNTLGRFTFGLYFPYVIDSANNNRLLVGGDWVLGGLQESNDRGATFTSLSQNTLFGTNITLVAAATYQGAYVADPRFTDVTDLGASSDNPSTIYVASDRSDIYVTKDHGTSWKQIDIPAFGATIADLEVDPRNRDTVYAVTNTFGNGSFGHVYKSTDAGQNWTDISSNLPDLPTWKLQIDARTGNVYIGNDQGVYVLPNGGSTWQTFGTGLPNVQVRDMNLDTSTNILTIATYGRSAFQIYLNQAQANAGGITAVSGASTWAGNVVLTGATTLGADGLESSRTGIPTASINFAGTISDQGTANTITKVGLGDITFSGTNTYAGQTNITQGTLIADNPFALSGSSTHVTAGAALALDSSISNNEPLFLNGDGPAPGFNGHNTGALESLANNNTYTGPITLETSSTIGVDSGSTLTITGAIGGAASATLTKELTGTLILDQAAGAPDTFSGATFVNQGVLQIASSYAYQSTYAATITVLDGAQLQLIGGITLPAALDLSGSGTSNSGAVRSISGANALTGAIKLDAKPGFSAVTYPVGAVAFGVDADSLAVTGKITEAVASGLTKLGAGTLDLGGTVANSYSGTTYINDGVIVLQNAQALGDPNNLPIQRATIYDPAGNGTYTLSLTIGTTTYTTGTIFTSDSPLTVKNDLNAVLPANIRVSSVTKNTVPVPGTSTNEIVLSIVLAGTGLAGLNLPQLVALASGGATVSMSVVAGNGYGTLVSSGTTLQLDLANSTTGNTVTESVQLNGTGVTGGGALENVSGNNTLAGNVVLNTSSTVGVDSAGTPAAPTDLEVTGIVSGRASSSLTKVGAGTLGLQGADTYAGTTFINAGILTAENNLALGSALTDDVQQIAVSGAGTGTYQLWFTVGTDTEHTGPISANATAAQVESAIAGLSNVGTGNVHVDRSVSGVYTVTFIGALGGVHQSQLTTIDPATGSDSTTPGTTVAIATVTDGGLGDTVVANGATLGLSGNIAISTERLTLSGSGVGGIGALASLSGSNSWNVDPTPVTPNTVAPDTSIYLNGPSAIGSNSVANGDGLTVTSAVADLAGTTAGANTLTKVGAGLMTFSGSVGNTYNDLTVVANGELDLAKTGGVTDVPANLQVGDGVGLPGTAIVKLVGANGTTGQVPNSATLTTLGDGLFDLNTQAQTVAALNMTGGTVTDSAAGHLSTLVTSALSASSDAAGDSAIITSRLGTFNLLNPTVNVTSGTSTLHRSDLDVQTPINTTTSLTKTGNGRLELDADNTASIGTLGGLPSPIVVNAGDVQVDGKVREVQLAGGSVSGIGTVGMIDSTTSGAPVGTIAPGDNGTATPYGLLTTAPGTAGSEAWGTRTVFSVDLKNAKDGMGNDAAGSGYDQLIFDGTGAAGLILNLGGASVAGTAGPSIGLGDQFTIIRATNGSFITGAFTATGTEAGGTPYIYVGGQKFDVTYISNGTAGEYSSVVLTRVIETATVAITSSGTPSVYGQDVVFTATVTVDNGAGHVPDGDTVTFTLDGGATYQATITGGKATFDPASDLSPNAPLSLGSHTIDAHFDGQGTGPNYSIAPVDAQQISQVVTKANTTSTVSVNSTYAYGAPITITATVNPTLQPTLTGESTPGSVSDSVNFYLDGSNTAAYSGVLNSSGQATFTPPANLAVGAHTVKVLYAGDTDFNSSSAGPASFTVNADTSTISLASDPGSSAYGQPVTFTAQLVVNGPGNPVNGANVKFYDGNTLLGSGTLTLNANGDYYASYTTSTLALGSHTIKAVFAGTTNVSGTSTGTAPNGANLTFVVSQVGTTTTLVANPSTNWNYNQPVTFTATVASTTGNSIPTGTVTFYDEVSGSPVQLAVSGNPATVNSSGNATVTISTLSGGPHKIYAVYNGTANYSTSRSTPDISQSVAYGSTTTLASSANPINYGTAVTFTATVAVGPGTPAGTIPPSGTVTFYDGTTQLGTAQPLNASNQATYTAPASGPNALTPGSHSITAVFTPDVGSSFNGSTSAAVNELVRSYTTTTVSTSPNPAMVNQPVTFSATVVENSPGAAVVTGKGGYVSFFDGSTLVAQVYVTNGVASYATPLAFGTHNITATYTGDTFNLGSQSTNTDTEVVKYGTNETLVSSANPSSLGQNVTFTATVGRAAGTPSTATLGGTFTFFDGTTQIGGPVAMDNSTGAASVTVNTLTLGSHTIKAVFTGNSSFAPNSATMAQSVVNATSTTLSTTANPSVYGQDVTYTATVTGTGTPTGTVSFKDGSTVLGTATLSGGTATFDINSLTVGTHNITAVYTPDTTDTTDGSSTSTAIAQVVQQDTTTTTVTSSSPGNQSSNGQSVTFTATVTQGSPGQIAPSWKVAFYDNGNLMSTVTFTNGVATYTTSSLGVGTHTITAVYGNTNSFSTSQGSTTQTVNPAASTTTLTSSANPSGVGQNVTFSAAVSRGPGTPSNLTLTGTVSFYDGTTLLGTTAMDFGSGVATYTTSTLGFGPHTIKAVFNPGNNNFASSTATLTQNVLHASTTTVSSSSNPSNDGQAVTFTATVTGSPPATMTGEVVTFTDGGVAIGTGRLNAFGQATFVTSTLAVGSHSIAAVYSGDASYAGSTSAAVSQSVQAVPTHLVATTPSGVLSKTNFSITATIEDKNNNAVATFSGSASIAVLSGPGTLSGTTTATFSNGQATFSALQVSAAGTYTLRITASDGLTVDVTFSVAMGHLG